MGVWGSKYQRKEQMIGRNENKTKERGSTMSNTHKGDILMARGLEMKIDKDKERELMGAIPTPKRTENQEIRVCCII